MFPADNKAADNSTSVLFQQSIKIYRKMFKPNVKVRNLKDLKNTKEFSQYFTSAMGKSVDGLDDNEMCFPQIKETALKAISEIKDDVSAMEKITKLLGGKNDSMMQRKKAVQHREKIFDKANVSCVTLTFMVNLAKHSDKQTRLESQKVLLEFKKVVKSYYKVNREFAAKTRKYPLKEAEVDLLEHDEMAQMEERLLQKQRETRLFVDLDEDVAQMENRVNELEKIENDVREINELFRDIAQMVGEQGEQVDEIETNVEIAEHQVSQAATALREAEKFSGDRKCLISAAAIIVTLVILLVIIVKLI